MKRIQQLQEQLSLWDVDGCLVENPIDLFYLTGLTLSTGSLLVCTDSVCLFVDGRYKAMVQETGVVPYGDILELDRHLKNKKIAFDSSTTVYQRFVKLEKTDCALKAIPGLTKELRVIKDSQEIAILKKSGKLALSGIEYVATLLKPGVTEKELAREFELFCLEGGASGLSFPPIIAFGSNSALPHYRSGNRVLQEGDIVLIDAGAILNNYCSDLTRMVFFGKEDPQLKKMYDSIREAHKAALSCCRPGTPLRVLDETARKSIEDAGLGELIVHGLGHGVGLEVHEFPSVNMKGDDKDVLLRAGMVITIEPGLYLPGKGGVRYEDTIIITDNGYEFAL
ncbi:MAG: Xaa-Pro peptidase family protein [Chlamydiota bacterium]